MMNSQPSVCFVFKIRAFVAVLLRGQTWSASPRAWEPRPPRSELGCPVHTEGGLRSLRLCYKNLGACQAPPHLTITFWGVKPAYIFMILNSLGIILK